MNRPLIKKSELFFYFICITFFTSAFFNLGTFIISTPSSNFELIVSISRFGFILKLLENSVAKEYSFKIYFSVIFSSFFPLL